MSKTVENEIFKLSVNIWKKLFVPIMNGKYNVEVFNNKELVLVYTGYDLNVMCRVFRSNCISIITVVFSCFLVLLLFHVNKKYIIIKYGTRMLKII